MLGRSRSEAGRCAGTSKPDLCCRSSAAMMTLASADSSIFLQKNASMEGTSIARSGQGSVRRTRLFHHIAGFTPLVFPLLPEQRAIAGVLRDGAGGEGGVRAGDCRHAGNSSTVSWPTSSPTAPSPSTKPDEVVLREYAAGRSSRELAVGALERLIAEGPQNGLYRPSSDYGTGTPIIRIDDYPNEGGYCAQRTRAPYVSTSVISTRFEVVTCL